jgi:hypothetical protein
VTKINVAKKRKKNRSKPSKKILLPSLLAISKILIVILILAAIGIGLVFLKRFVNTKVPVSQKRAIVELVDAPVWLNEDLKKKIYDAARANGENLKLDEDAAKSVQQNIQRQVSWLKDITVQATNDRLLIKAKWRKPLVLIKLGIRRYYLDSEMVVLDFISVPSLPIVQIKDPSLLLKRLIPGKILRSDSALAAVEIISKLDRMDSIISPDKPLLYEIKSIDVANYNGRNSVSNPHIVLLTSDDTKIIWGAKIGAWQRHLEAPDEEKFAKLYAYYKKYGTLLNNVKYINLRDPQDNIFQPIDKY